MISDQARSSQPENEQFSRIISIYIHINLQQSHKHFSTPTYARVVFPEAKANRHYSTTYQAEGRQHVTNK